MTHNAANFEFGIKPDWVENRSMKTSDGHEIVDEVGVLERADDRDYWKAIQRIETDGEYRIRPAVWSYTDEDGRHRDARSDLTVPMHIWNQLCENAKAKGLYKT